nr:MAG: putative capsid protein [Arizlama virus]
MIKGFLIKSWGGNNRKKIYFFLLPNRKLRPNTWERTFYQPPMIEAVDLHPIRSIQLDTWSIAHYACLLHDARTRSYDRSVRSPVLGSHVNIQFIVREFVTLIFLIKGFLIKSWGGNNRKKIYFFLLPNRKLRPNTWERTFYQPPMIEAVDLHPIRSIQLDTWSIAHYACLLHDARTRSYDRSVRSPVLGSDPSLMVATDAYCLSPFLVLGGLD